jgi:hypothetical protein
MHSSAYEQRGELSNTTGPHGTPLPHWSPAASSPSAPPLLDDVPHVQVFSEGNGNEHRRSFKGYAQGYAQLIQSPSVWANNPMIININKRCAMLEPDIARR